METCQPMSQSASMLYNYIFTTRSKNTQRHLSGSCEQISAPGQDMLKRKADQEGLYEETQREAEEWAGSQSRAKMRCSLGLTLRGGMLSNSQKEQKERRGKEEREGEREE